MAFYKSLEACVEEKDWNYIVGAKFWDISDINMSFVLQVFIPNKQSFKKPFVKEENIVKQFIFLEMRKLMASMAISLLLVSEYHVF